MLRMQLGGQPWATDDVSGAAHDVEKVMEGRLLEIAYFRKMCVYDKVDRSMAKGFKLVRTKWIDTNKGDYNNADYRSRLVAMEFNEYADPFLFAATPQFGGGQSDT